MNCPAVMELPSKLTPRRNDDHDIIIPTLKSTSNSGGKKRGQSSASTVLSIDSSDCGNSIGTNGRKRAGGGSGAAKLKAAEEETLSPAMQKLKDFTSFVMPRKQHLETPMPPAHHLRPL